MNTKRQQTLVALGSAAHLTVRDAERLRARSAVVVAVAAFPYAVVEALRQAK